MALADVVLAVAVVLVMRFDPNQYKAELATLVKQLRTAGTVTSANSYKPASANMPAAPVDCVVLIGNAASVRPSTAASTAAIGFALSFARFRKRNHQG